MFKNYGIRAIADIRAALWLPISEGLLYFPMYREVLRFMWRLRDFHSISLRRRMDSQSGLMVFTFMSLGIAREIRGSV